MAPTSPLSADTVEASAPTMLEANSIRATLSGNAEAFNEVVRLHHRRVYLYLIRMTRHHHDAEDLTQQTFVKAFHYLSTFDQSRPLLNWIFTIARNLTLNHFRDTKRWEQMPLHAPDGARSPAETAERNGDVENIWDRARQTLPRREFEILWLRFGEDLTTRETARIVELTESHVKVLLHRARQSLIELNPSDEK